MKKKIIIFALIFAVILTLGLVFLINSGAYDKVISQKGYELLVPDGFSLDGEGNITNKKGEKIGKFLLISSVPDVDKAEAYSGVEVSGDVKTTHFKENMIKNEFDSKEGKVIQYFAYNIPNPEPYAISFTFYRNKVRESVCDKIAGSFKIPEIGSQPPPKNIPAYQYGAIGNDKLVKVTLLDGSIMVENISYINNFIKWQTESKNAGLEIVEFEQQTSGMMLLKNWYYIESDGGRGYAYVYYDKGDGTYTYDNNPICFSGISKEVSEEKGLVYYSLKVGEMNATSLFEVPLNIYRENAEELMHLKVSVSSEESIKKILERIMTKEQMSQLSFSKNGRELIIEFSKSEILDRGKLSKDAVILFALIGDIDTITVSDNNGSKFVFERKRVLGNVEGSAKSTEDFVKLTEEVEKLSPAEPESMSNDGEIVYSGTVVISRGSKVTHPKTGERVVVDSYAEKYGVSHYLGKPITCTIRRTGSGYIATAVCGGSVIATNDLETEAELNNMISMIEAYS